MNSEWEVVYLDNRHEPEPWVVLHFGVDVGGYRFKDEAVAAMNARITK